MMEFRRWYNASNTKTFQIHKGEIIESLYLSKTSKGELSRYDTEENRLAKEGVLLHESTYIDL